MKAKIVTVTLNPALDKTVTVERFQYGEVNRVCHLRVDAGGKGINVAKVLHRFGVPVLATGLIAGMQGNQLAKRLAEEGVPFDFVEVPGETRVNLKIVDAAHKVTTEINEPGFSVAPQDLARFAEKLAAFLDEAAVLVLSGSLPRGVAPSVYADFIRLAHQKGVKTILDADGPALAEGLRAQPFAVKPNLSELARLVGRPLSDERDIVEAGKTLLETGVSLAVISMGKDGAVVMDRREGYRAWPFDVEPQSTVGAGDAMVAAVAYALLAHRPLEEIARWATAAGTVTAAKSGTQVCTLEEVRCALDRVRVAALGVSSG